MHVYFQWLPPSPMLGRNLLTSVSLAPRILIRLTQVRKLRLLYMSRMCSTIYNENAENAHGEHVSVWYNSIASKWLYNLTKECCLGWSKMEFWNSIGTSIRYMLFFVRLFPLQLFSWPQLSHHLVVNRFYRCLEHFSAANIAQFTVVTAVENMIDNALEWEGLVFIWLQQCLLLFYSLFAGRASSHVCICSLPGLEMMALKRFMQDKAAFILVSSVLGIAGFFVCCEDDCPDKSWFTRKCLLGLFNV